MNWGRAFIHGVALAAIGTIAVLAVAHLRPDARSEAREGVVVGPGGIPLVKAEPGPVKVKPKDPGGLKVPHRDKAIYERLEGERRVAPAGDPRKKAPQTASRPNAKSGQKDLAQDVGPYRVQLGAFADNDSAQRRWRQLRSRHADVIGGLQMMLERVEVRAKGTVYRLQAGPLKSPAEVQKVCASLAKRKVGCFLVKS